MKVVELLDQASKDGPRGSLREQVGEHHDAGEVFDSLNPALVLRIANGDVECFFFARERGEKGNNPHSNGHYDLKVSTDTVNNEKAMKALLDAEHKWLKSVLSASTPIRFRLLVKTVNPKDRKKVYGYDQKDQYKPHYIFICGGLSDEFLREAAELWLSIAARNAYSSKKCDKTPNSDSKLLAFTVGNVWTLIAWFIAHHHLKRISKYLTPAIVIAWALQTGRYRLDDALVTGKNGGVALDAARAQAFYDIGQLCENHQHGDSLENATVTIPLIETILFGAPQPKPSTYDSECLLSGIPTTTEFAAEHSLASAKALCARLEREAGGGPRASKGGRFIVIDFMSSSSAALAATTMEQAGLARATLFNMEQLPRACGYLAASWACMLRNLGLEFQSLGMDEASSANDQTVISDQNARLGIPELGTEARWLEGDEVLTLVDTGDADPLPSGRRWVSGPGPINFWHTHFAKTVNQAYHHGKVHIMIVNTEAVHDMTPDTGAHWFVTAWYIEPDSEEASQQTEMPRTGDDEIDDDFMNGDRGDASHAEDGGFDASQDSGRLEDDFEDVDTIGGLSTARTAQMLVEQHGLSAMDTE